MVRRGCSQRARFLLAQRQLAVRRGSAGHRVVLALEVKEGASNYLKLGRGSLEYSLALCSTQNAKVHTNVYSLLLYRANHPTLHACGWELLVLYISYGSE